MLQQKREDEPGDQVGGKQHGDEDDHRADHHFHRVPVGLPNIFPEALGSVGIMIVEPVSAGHIRHIGNGSAVVIIPDFFLFFLFRHGAYSSSSRWQAAK